jgi:hypothetical protein
MMMVIKRHRILYLLVLLFWMAFCAVDKAGQVTSGPLDAPPDVFWANIKTSQELADFFEKRSNLRTGLSLSFFGDNRPIALYGTQIYDVGLRLLAESSLSQKIIETFARNSSSRATRDTPQTVGKGNINKEGIFSWIRIEGFDQPGWWHTWEWSIKTGENAWLGKGALHYYRQTRDPQGLQIARERAEFILGLQDMDGGVRVGPEHPKNNLWWKVKSTENNESALNFFDEIYLTTHESRYKEAADRIYRWLMSTMYDRHRHLFLQGQVYKDDKWVINSLENFATDTTSWAPFKRMLDDSRLGKNKLERLAEVERMLDATVASTGVFQEGILKGMSYSPVSRKDAVISVEWSAQFALRYLLVSVAYQEEGRLDKATEYYRKYTDLTLQLQGYLQERDGERTAPYAVYPDGRIAVNEPMWDEWTRTPGAYASVAAHLYLGFALRRFDPLLDRNI